MAENKRPALVPVVLSRADQILHYFKWKLTTSMSKLCCECSVQCSAKHIKNYSCICVLYTCIYTYKSVLKSPAVFVARQREKVIEEQAELYR